MTTRTIGFTSISPLLPYLVLELKNTAPEPMIREIIAYIIFLKPPVYSIFFHSGIGTFLGFSLSCSYPEPATSALL
jgi:hypothetical protein